MKYLRKIFESEYYQELTDMMVILSDTFDGFIDIDIHSDFYIMQNYTTIHCEENYLQDCTTFDNYINNSGEKFDSYGFKISFEYDPKIKFFNTYYIFYTKFLNILNSLDGKIEEFGYSVDPESTGFGELDDKRNIGICIGFQKIKNKHGEN